MERFLRVVEANVRPLAIGVGVWTATVLAYRWYTGLACLGGRCDGLSILFSAIFVSALIGFFAGIVANILGCVRNGLVASVIGMAAALPLMPEFTYTGPEGTNLLVVVGGWAIVMVAPFAVGYVLVPGLAYLRREYTAVARWPRQTEADCGRCGKRLSPPIWRSCGYCGASFDEFPPVLR